jgi:RND family efflux transporter MFP subunit
MVTHTWSRCLLLAAGVIAAGCSDAPKPQEKPPPIVTVSLPIEKHVTDHVDFRGQTAAVESVQVRARVGGYLEKVDFKEGDMVKKDQVLFEIDPRPYQTDLDRAQAQVKAREAQKTQAESEYQRTRTLYQKGAASQEDLEKAERTRDLTVAGVAASEANVRVQELNLGFTKVLAPIAGRIDKANVTVGNLVSASLQDATILTNIVTIAPMYVYFEADELTMLRIQQMVREGKLKAHQDQAPEVLLGLGDKGSDFPIHGTIDFVGNQVDPDKGNISVRAVFPNKDLALAPGLFARVRVPLGKPHTALLVSDRALGTNLGQKFLYIVNDENEVVYRPVTLGALHGGLREVTAGLKPGERVIINGLLRVRPGITVEPKTGEMQPQPAGAGATK